jgi:dinuclear metal center YbgI/SA1388 family protein
MKLESILQYLHSYLELGWHPDYPNAMNGLQVEGKSDVRHICAAVDASESAIEEGVRRGADLLLVHHGMFWEGSRPLTGRRFRKVSRLVSAEMGLYSVHLPLDSHPEVGNCALLARRLGIDLKGRFGAFQGTEIGWWGTVDTPREAFGELIERVVGGPVRLIPGGKEHVDRVGVVTGGGGSLLGQAVAAGLDTYVTGEASHHTFLDATEERVNVYLAGHYATETLGVQALAEHLAQSFGLTWEFIDLPSGL